MRKAERLVGLVVALAFFSGAMLVRAEEGRSFAVALLPDTQLYSRDRPDIYMAQTQWIKTNATAENIRFVIHLGDLVQNVEEESQWEAADKAHAVLDGVVPYTVVHGNHEMPIKGLVRVRDLRMFDRYFPPKRFASWPWYGGQMAAESWANSYCKFDAAGMKFLVLGLEFLPRDATLQWAGEVVAKYPDCRVIVATHSYIARGGLRDKKPPAKSLEGNNGESVWQKFVRKHENVFMVVAGHIGAVAHLTSTNDAGEPVHQILSDFQNEENGGNGWMPLLRFFPEKDRIDVRVYSPVMEKYREGPTYNFSLEYGMKGKVGVGR